MDDEADDASVVSEETSGSGGTDVDGDGPNRVFDLAEHWSVDIETAVREVEVVRSSCSALLSAFSYLLSHRRLF